MINFIITIDQGNTNTKIGLFNIQENSFSNLNQSQLEESIKNHLYTPLNTRMVLSSVVSQNFNIDFPITNIKEFFKDNKFLDMPVLYSESLGIDRLAISYYCFNHFKNKSLVIDSGTFTTSDIVEESGFSGGYILPGIELIKKTYQAGNQLKSPDSIEIVTNKLPQTTENAISQGALLSIISPINEIIYRNKPQNIILTGGNGDFLAKLLKKQPFQQDASIQFDSNLIHKALRVIALKGI